MRLNRIARETRQNPAFMRDLWAFRDGVSDPTEQMFKVLHLHMPRAAAIEFLLVPEQPNLGKRRRVLARAGRQNSTLRRLLPKPSTQTDGFISNELRLARRQPNGSHFPAHAA
jgi:hypothetical protein